MPSNWPKLESGKYQVRGRGDVWIQKLMRTAGECGLEQTF